VGENDVLNSQQDITRRMLRSFVLADVKHGKESEDQAAVWARELVRTDRAISNFAGAIISSALSVLSISPRSFFGGGSGHQQLCERRGSKHIQTHPLRGLDKLKRTQPPAARRGLGCGLGDRCVD